MQRSDAPARNVPGYWLGDPSAGWRWPFDATFTAWKVWAISVVPAFILLWLVVPLVVFLFATAWAVARLARRGAPPLFVRDRNVTPWIGAGSVLLLAVGLTTNPLAWLVPLHWLPAGVLAPLLALAFTRTVMPWVATNTPLRYWSRLLPRVAAGPRPRRGARTMASSSIEADEAWDPLILLALTIDPSEIRMPTAVPRVEPVEFDQWLPHDPDRAAATLAWLFNAGFQCDIAEDRTLEIRNRAGGRCGTVRPANYVIITTSTVGGISTMHPEVFARAYRVEESA